MQKPYLNILFPAGSFYPAQTGGPDNTVYWITKALTRQGHQVYVTTSDRGVNEGVPRNRWLDTNYGRVIYSPDYVHYLPLGILRRTLGKLGQVDVLHLAMIFYPASWLLAIINSLFYGKPMMWSSHGDLDPPMLLRSRKKKALVLWLINKLVRKDLLTFHSTCDAETEYIRNNFGADARIVQILNYMELPAPLDLPRERYLLYIGRIDPKKAVENLLTALADSTEFRQSDFVLKIVGDADNEYGRSLKMQCAENGIKNKVHFLGHREGTEKEELLAGAWFVLMPSHTENFGIVVIEALAQSTPAVASTGTPWAILPERDAGHWVDNDPASLREVVEEIITYDNERMDTLGQNALELVREEFSIHNNIDKWETAYHQVAGK